MVRSHLHSAAFRCFGLILDGRLGLDSAHLLNPSAVPALFSLICFLAVFLAIKQLTLKSESTKSQSNPIQIPEFRAKCSCELEEILEIASCIALADRPTSDKGVVLL